MCLECGMLPERLKKGIQLLEENGYFNTAEGWFSIKAVWGDKILIEKSDRDIRIIYDTEPHFYMALARSVKLKDGIHEITPSVKNFGLMLDCSRNAVTKPDRVKHLICLLVLLGYDYLELYTEDTYEIPDEPYFGHMRGRYSREELKEIVDFAAAFGFELVPCIQTLAHLNQLRSWDTYADYMDIDDILLAEDERTYALIRKCISFCKEVFRTKRINIGTDEAFHLGRGKYIDRFGYRPKHDIYLEHLKNVFAICREEGLEPEFWGDAFYMQEGADGFANYMEETKAIFDGSQSLIYWEYSSRDKEYHSANIRKLKAYGDKVIYAGGLWEWVGFAPFCSHSNQVVDAAFEAAAENGVDNILLTIWGDDGAESSAYTVLPSMCYAAQRVYPCDVTVNDMIFYLTGYTEEEWLLMDQPNVGMIAEENTGNAAKCLLYNDFLIGLMDYHIPDHAGAVYQDLFTCFDKLKNRDSEYAYLFSCMAGLCHVLSRKATFGKRLYQAYQGDKKEDIRSLADELLEIKQDIKSFHKALRKRWFIENKGFGFEVLDVRIGGLIARADTVRHMLLEYLEGHTDKIYELEEKRIPYWKDTPEGKRRYTPYHNDWKTIYTANRM